ncbi:PH domain-containing protein [Hazenella sp. IB182357]|uniref:PH domain-containing protein n=1 Tax=Polycladospora coralii TaxID=2771432 RepID=A0A926RV91_9BACL|nr:PH domain-containing protein [Polycladospora coralii]MBD1373547.1 PH domain-containing protein [Polycladospora coralii]
MTKTKRHHPLLMLIHLWTLAKRFIFFVVYLFVIKADSESSFIIYGRIIIFAAFGIMVITIIWTWFTHKYKLDHKSFHLYKGIFIKSEQTIPFSKIQNVHRHTSYFHRVFKVTSIHFETGMTGEETTVKFEVISHIEADRLEAHIKSTDGDALTTDDVKDTKHANLNRNIHFEPTKMDILKASFTSLSFLILIPLVGSFYSKINGIFHMEKEAKGVFMNIISSEWMVTIIIMVLVIASVTFGIVRTFLAYGKYQISSDHDRIYITKGVIEETSFSISKEKVQAIEIKQSIMKRLLGLAEVKLTSAGSFSSDEETLEINSLYPFLPVKRAYDMVSEILPSYEVKQKMIRLPRKSLWVRLIKPSWIWFIATAILFYFRPSILKVEQAWWILSAVLFILIAVLRLLEFMNTRFILNNQFIQFKTGGMTTSLFISKRDKIIEVKVTRNIIQQMIGLASIGTIHRAKPVHHAGVDDVPLELATSFYHWYMGRKNEIKLE